MSLSSKNLSSIQKAGQAVHDASEAISATVRIQAESMVASMSTAPFSAESEQSISRFKTLSKLSQGLAALEAQLQELYSMATELANPASDVIVLTVISKRKALTNASAVDVTPKPPKAAKKVKKGGRKAVALTANDNQLFGFLQGILKAGEATVVTGNEMSDGSGLPRGSVGVSLKKIISTGAVKQVARGTYQLVLTTAVPVEQPVVRSAPTKKIKAVKAATPAAKEVKATLAKKARAVSKTSVSDIVANEPDIVTKAASV